MLGRGAGLLREHAAGAPGAPTRAATDRTGHQERHDDGREEDAEPDEQAVAGRHAVGPREQLLDPLEHLLRHALQEVRLSLPVLPAQQLLRGPALCGRPVRLEGVRRHAVGSSSVRARATSRPSLRIRRSMYSSATTAE